MFLGTTPHIISQFVLRELRNLKPEVVRVPFSGNFIFETLAAQVPEVKRIICTDVSLYSSAIGWYLTDTHGQITISEEIKNDYPGMKIETPEDIAAMVIFLQDLSVHYSKPGITYYERMLAHAKANWPAYIEKIREKLRKCKAEFQGKKIDFRSQDANVMLREVEKGDVVLYDPPTIFHGYEKLYKWLHQNVGWSAPYYSDIVEETRWDHFKMFDERGAVCYYRNNNPCAMPEGWPLVYRYKHTEKSEYCIYTNNRNVKPWVGKREKLRTKDPGLKLLGVGDEITAESKVQVVQVKNQYANHYRVLWVKKADMVDIGKAWLVLIDGKMTGVLMISSGQQFSNEFAMLVSDPATPTSRYKRLSKLMLFLVSTQEMLNMVNDEFLWEHTGVTTSVTSEHPESMKYRGVFQLHKRTENKVPGGYKYTLIYHSQEILPTFKDGLKRWLDKFGNQVK